jgi:hypothetical protein
VLVDRHSIKDLVGEDDGNPQRAPVSVRRQIGERPVVEAAALAEPVAALVDRQCWQEHCQTSAEWLTPASDRITERLSDPKRSGCDVAFLGKEHPVEVVTGNPRDQYRGASGEESIDERPGVRLGRQRKKARDEAAVETCGEGQVQGMGGYSGSGADPFGHLPHVPPGTNPRPEQRFVPDTSRAQLVHESIVPYRVRLSSGHDDER